MESAGIRVDAACTRYRYFRIPIAVFIAFVFAQVHHDLVRLSLLVFEPLDLFRTDSLLLSSWGIAVLFPNRACLAAS